MERSWLCHYFKVIGVFLQGKNNSFSTWLMYVFWILGTFLKGKHTLDLHTEIYTVICFTSYLSQCLFFFFFVALLLAYMNGNGNLCRALVRAHACMGTCNRQGINIFNTQVATTQLLRRLLGRNKFTIYYINLLIS